MYCIIKAVKSHLSPPVGLVHVLLGFVAVVLAIIVLAMPFHAFITTWAASSWGNELAVKAWKELLLLAAILVLVVLWWPLRRSFGRVLRQPLALLILIYAALHGVLVLAYDNAVEPSLAGLMTNLRFLAIFLVAQLLVAALPGLSGRLRRWLAALTLVSGLIVAGLGILQVTVVPPTFLEQFGYDKQTSIAPFITIDENPEALRAFATLRGPNTFGMFLLLPMAMLVVLAARRRFLTYVIPGLALVLTALLLSGSRSAWIGAVVTLVTLGLLLLGQQRLWRLARRYGLYAGLAVIALVVAAFEVPALRLAIFHSSPGDSSLTEGSTDQHWLATAGGIADALAHPLGRGPGQAGPASFYEPSGGRIAENYYVQVTQETGWLGLALLLAILWLVARRLWRLAAGKRPPLVAASLLASFCGIAVINIFLHGWADDPTALVWWALAGLLPLEAAKMSKHDRR